MTRKPEWLFVMIVYLRELPAFVFLSMFLLKGIYDNLGFIFVDVSNIPTGNNNTEINLLKRRWKDAKKEGDETWAVRRKQDTDKLSHYLIRRNN